LKSYHHSLATPASGSRTGSYNGDVEKEISSTERSHTSLKRDTTVGVIFIVKKSTGLTRQLAAHDNLLTFLDGPYPNNPTSSVLRTDRLLITTGGIGIFGVLPWRSAHHNVKFYWSVV
jgi:hypothetical protein